MQARECICTVQREFMNTQLLPMRRLNIRVSILQKSMNKPMINRGKSRRVYFHSSKIPQEEKRNEEKIRWLSVAL